MTAETLGASQVKQYNMLVAIIKHAMTSSCVSLLKHVRLLNGCNATWVGWTKGVSTDNRNTTAMVLTSLGCHP